MSYQILKEDGQGEAVSEVPGYPNATVSDTPRGYVYVPLASTNQDQQTSITATVVASQPRTLPQVSVVEPKPKTKPAILIFSLVLAIICGIHLCLPAFVCLTPALVFAIVGYSLSDSPEQRNTAKAFHGVSLCCNIASIVYYVLAAIAAIVTLGVMLGYHYRYSDYDYYYHYNYYGGCYEDCSDYSYNYDGYGYDEYDYGCQTLCVN